MESVSRLNSYYSDHLSKTESSKKQRRVSSGGKLIVDSKIDREVLQRQCDTEFNESPSSFLCMIPVIPSLTFVSSQESWQIVLKTEDKFFSSCQ